MMIGTLGFALLAGVLSILSPCVLPIVPLVLGTAVAEHRLGPVALAAGLALSFTAIGLFVATIGFAIGLDTQLFRGAAASVLIAIGVVLLVPPIQTRLATAAGPLGSWTDERFAAMPTAGLSGQFAVGLLLGAIWSPCVGPTLGAASIMAARGENLVEVSLTMLAFGIGAAAPLLLLGVISREALLRWRQRLLSAGKGTKMLMGAALVAFGMAIVTGADKRIEAVLVEASPQWLTDLTTRY